MQFCRFYCAPAHCLLQWEMWLYIFTIALCVCLWKLATGLWSLLKWYREIYKCLSHFPLPEDHHWLFGVAHVIKDGNAFYQVLQKTVDKMQPKAIACWLTWIRPSLVVVHPETVKAVLKASHVSAPKSSEYLFLKAWIGDGLIGSGGAKWARNRHLLTPAFHFDVLKPYVQIYNDVAGLFLDKIKLLASDGKSIDVKPLVSRATLDNVLRCALSYVDESVQSTEKGQHPYVKAVGKVRGVVCRRMLNPLIYNDTIYSFTSDSKTMKNCCEYLHEFSDNLIQHRRKSIEADQSQLKKRHLDFLDILLTARDENGVGMTDREIRDEVDTFTFAGHDTTASSIMWTLYALAKYPKMQQQVRDEVKDILMGRAILQFDDLPKLQYTTRFIKETLRMFSPVPSTTRRLAEPLTIDGVAFPVGSNIDISQYHVHHNPAVWENHNEFDPDRFLPEKFATKDPFSFVPFSAGQRNCIGQHFAMDETKVFVSQAARRFDIRLDEDNPADPDRDIVTSAKSGIFLHFKEL